jgi:hypothetical protein
MTSTVVVRVSGITLPRQRNADDSSTNVRSGTKVHRHIQRSTTDGGYVFRAN